MCGIFCFLSPCCKADTLLEQFQHFKKSILHRGPDSIQSEMITQSEYTILFAASVLWLQGAEITKQPLKSEDNILLYNGDIFGGSISDELRAEWGDTGLLFEKLNNSVDISHTLDSIEGPYAFIYLKKLENRIYFGRDPYGRRSLLIGRNSDQIIITSVAKRRTNFQFMELPSIGIFTIDLATKTWGIQPWKHKNKNFESKLQELKDFVGNITTVATNELEMGPKFRAPTNSDLQIFKTNSETNVFETLLNNTVWFNKVLFLKQLLENAIQKRLATQTKFCRNCFQLKTCTHAPVGVLFSGGIDCAVLALLSSQFIDTDRPIDLINVAFEKCVDYKTPDRITGIETLKELQRLAPERTWNFLEVNVTTDELNSARTETIADLIYPLKSVLDDSLGCALWFASRGKTSTYTSPSRVLLVGMGADELFGGYTRHRGALQKHGWEGLHSVLEEDWQNLSHRNLARDDRVASDHGRQLRTPYLDEQVVRFVRGLPSWEKTCPSPDLPQGVGEKILLRCLAYHLGLTNAASLKKRALQFGSRIANPKENAHEVSLRLE